MTVLRRIRNPEQLPAFPQEAIDLITESLTPDGSKRFLREVYEAAALSQRTGDLAYLNRVLETWYRSLMFIAKPDFRERVDLARKDPGPPMDKEQIQSRWATAAGARE
nr:hypothetical protein [Actinomycetota bacterium]